MIESNHRKVFYSFAVIVLLIGIFLAMNGQNDFFKGSIKTRDVSLKNRISYDEEYKFIDRIQNTRVKEDLKKLLDYKLRPGEKFDQDKNIVSTIQTKNGPKTVTFLGYESVKKEYLRSQKLNSVNLKELSTESIKKTKLKDVQLDSKATTLSINTSTTTQKDELWTPEKPDTKVGSKPEDSICAARGFEKGAVSVAKYMQNSVCVGLYRGIPITWDDSQIKFGFYGIYSYGLITEISFQEAVFSRSTEWFCKKDGLAVIPGSLYEVKKCIDTSTKDFEMAGYGVEVCDNNVDDDGDGKADCADATSCTGYITVDYEKRDAICVADKREICSVGKNIFGTVTGSGYFEALCFNNGSYKSWAECDADNLPAEVYPKKGPGGLTKKEGEIVNSGGCSYICSKHNQESKTKYGKEKWVGCGCNLGPGGIKAADGDFYGGRICNQSQWIEASTINSINPTLLGSDYSPQGLMYWGKELYDEEVFPLLPKLTPVRDQGGRGTCLSFAQVGAIEMLLPDNLDLSEQNYAYHIATEQDNFNNPIGLEKEWPYNPDDCKTGYYSTPFGVLTCSDLPGQPIHLGNGAYGQPSTIAKTDSGGCFTASILPFSSKEWLEEVINVLHSPLTANLYIDTSGSNIGEAGFLKKEFFSSQVVSIFPNAHAMLIVAFIPKDKIPEDVKLNPDFMPDQDYLILKNSWGTEVGDAGFLYAPASFFTERVYGLLLWKYDGSAKNCPASPV